VVGLRIILPNIPTSHSGRTLKALAHPKSKHDSTERRERHQETACVMVPSS